MFLCGTEAWSVRLMKERRPWVFLGRVLKEVFGYEKEEMETGEIRTMRSFSSWLVFVSTVMN